MKLTNKKVEQLTTNTKSYIVWDTDVRGFGVRVNLNAKKNLSYNLCHSNIIIKFNYLLYEE